MNYTFFVNILAYAYAKNAKKKTGENAERIHLSSPHLRFFFSFRYKISLSAVRNKYDRIIIGSTLRCYKAVTLTRHVHYARNMTLASTQSKQTLAPPIWCQRKMSLKIMTDTKWKNLCFLPPCFVLLIF